MKNTGYLIAYLRLSLAVLLIGLAVFLLFPSARFFFIEEDRGIENFSVLFYLLTFIAGSIYALRVRKYRILPLVIAIIGLLGLLDELSFGERIFPNYKPPVLYYEEVDALHDLFKITYHMVRDFFYPHKMAALVFLICTCLATALILYRFREKLRELMVFKEYKQSYLIMLSALIMLCGAQIIDLELIHSDLLFSIEEMLEMNGAAGFLFAALSLRQSSDAPENPS